MSHNHSHHPDHAAKNIVTVFFLNLLFAAIELVGGLMTNSIAILSDALHDTGDCVSLGVAWVLQRKSRQGRDNRYSYGYKRFSLLGSVFLSGVLAVSSVFVVVQAIKRLFDPQAVHAQGMLWLAVLGIVINGAAAWRLKRGSSLNERAVFIHIMEDVLGWVAVLVVSIVMLFVEVPMLDPLLSIGITAWVMTNVYRNLRATFRVLLQATPDGMDLEQLTAELSATGGVQSLHDLHVWTQDGESHVMTLHVVAERDNQSCVKQAVRQIADRYHIEHVTVEFESGDEPCEYINNKD